MLLHFLIALAAASPGAAQWRVAAMAETRISYVEPDRITRKGRKATFLLVTAWREAEGVEWTDKVVTLNCRSRKWRASAHWGEDDGRFVVVVEKARPPRGSYLGDVIDSVCAGTYRSGPIEDKDSDATKRLALDGQG